MSDLLISSFLESASCKTLSSSGLVKSIKANRI